MSFKAGVLALSTWLAACFSSPGGHPAGAGLPRITHFDTRDISYILVADDVATEARARYREAAKDTLEDMVCLYGRIGRDTMYIDTIRVADITGRTRHSVSYRGANNQGCAITPRFLGTWHTHLSGPWPVSSSQDNASYWRDTRAVLLTVAVGEGPDGILVYWALRDGRWGLARWQ